MARNLELKARYPTPEALRIARALPAKDRGILRQIDTYFRIDGSRLKLRVMKSKSAELIWYDRPDRRGPRTSHYTIVNVPNPASVKRMLGRLFGVKVIVQKTRRLFLHRNARIHIDRVRGLGTFLEFEVVVKHGERQAKRLMRELRKAFEISPGDLISSSYSDLVIKRKQRNTP